MFFNWIYKRSNVQILMILVAFFVVLLDLMPRLLQAIPLFSPTEDSTRLGLSLFGSIITLSGLLIGFLLNQAQTNFREVQSLVSREAGQINNLDRLLVRYGDPTIAPMRQMAMYTDILKKAEEVAESRESRIERSSVRLPNLFWVVIIICMVALLGINTLFLPSHSFFVGLKILPVTLGALISLLVITDQPFKGQSSVKAEPFLKIIESIKTRTE